MKHPYLLALEKVRDNVDYWLDNGDKLNYWFFPEEGVCLNMERAMFGHVPTFSGEEEPETIRLNYWIWGCTRTWAERDLSLLFPVGGSREYHSSGAVEKWKNEKRIRFLEYLIEKAKELE